MNCTYLQQPRGPGTVWMLRLPVPHTLVGTDSPFTRGPFGKTLKPSLRTTDKRAAMDRRDEVVGQVKHMVRELPGDERLSTEATLAWKSVIDSEPGEPGDVAADALLESLDQIVREAPKARRAEVQAKASKVYKIATARGMPLDEAERLYIKSRAGQLVLPRESGGTFDGAHAPRRSW